MQTKKTETTPTKTSTKVFKKNGLPFVKLYINGQGWELTGDELFLLHKQLEENIDEVLYLISR